ncbi:RagB/SusD family nutrient uptake outer membrane protein [Sphingobacterium sp. LRF_L2]|uniref:RagB/SusD family nutrient uptake outer membrane protein n=1 Tax=Sphingobacterium sp. LRF_L2 TaxID=3369421 RepID=UPI003F61A1D7
MKNLILGIAAAAFLLATSCTKWLDVQPESDIDQSVLFTTEEGFKEALLGVYTRCAKTDLYGKELTIGTPEVLAQNYTIASFDNYRYLQTKNYKYDDGNFISRKDNIWKGLYHGIVNANLILEQIDQKQQLFLENNYQLIKGEALALRAYLHFDALRLFAPSFLTGADSEGIPYVTSYSNKVTKMYKVREVLDSALRDLEMAKALLEDDPIRKASYVVGYPTVNDTLRNTELDNRSLFLQNRRHRLNYFAVCGALARIYLYKGDKTKALLNAQAVIDAKKFPWTNATDFLAVDDNKKDRIFYKELLFAWYIPGLTNDYNSNWFASSNNGMYLEQDDGRAIYEASGVGGTDMRYAQWFGTVGLGSSYISEVLKYRRSTLSENFEANLHYLVAPAIRLSELYYIAAECTYATDPTKAVAYLDEVRLHRGIGQKIQVTNESELRTELLKEYRKEMYGEGQLFYAFKRLNANIVGLQGTTVPASQVIFVWPLPDDEIIYGQR